MPKTFGVAAHAAGVGGDADPSRLRVAPREAVPLEEWRERMAVKAAAQAALRQRTRAAANAPAAAAHPPLESAAAKRARRNREIVAAYSSDPTATLTALAEQFGVGKARVKEVLEEAGVQVRRGRRTAAASSAGAVVVVEAKPVPTPEPEPAPAPASASETKPTSSMTESRADRVRRIADAIAAYLAGETVDVLAGRFHLQKAFLRQQLREAGVTLRDDRRTGSGGTNAKTAADDDPVLAAAIVDAYAGGLTIAAVAATVPGARSAKYVTNVLRRHGVQLRPSATGVQSDRLAASARNEQIVAAWHSTPRPTQQELATQFHLTAARISQILRQAGAQAGPARGAARREPAPSVPAPLSTPAPDEPDEPDEPLEVPDLPVEPAAAVGALSFADAARASRTDAPPATELTAPLPEDLRQSIHDVVCGLMDAAAALAGAAKGMSHLEAYAALLIPTTEGAPS